MHKVVFVLNLNKGINKTHKMGLGINIWYDNGHKLDFNETKEVFAEHTVCGCKCCQLRVQAPAGEMVYYLLTVQNRSEL